MSVPCDFTVHVRIVGVDGSTVRADLNAPDAGLSVASVQEPEETVRDLRVTAPRVDGSFSVASVDDDGFLVVIVDVDGVSWAQVEQRWQAIRSAYRAEPAFFVETEIEGVVKRYRTERPSVSIAGVESSSLVLKRQTYSIRFRVQPNPTVSYA